MNVNALFEKLSVDLAASGAREAPVSQGRTLEYDGTPFARLRGERMSFYLPAGTPAEGDALALETSNPAGEPGWVEVDSDDVSQWQRLAEQALTGLRRG